MRLFVPQTLWGLKYIFVFHFNFILYNPKKQISLTLMKRGSLQGKIAKTVGRPGTGHTKRPENLGLSV